ncbi:hypothetical protein T439DRAFT_357372 [Meredithblackwellia eburnea MCA 4105]
MFTHKTKPALLDQLGSNGEPSPSPSQCHTRPAPSSPTASPSASTTQKKNKNKKGSKMKRWWKSASPFWLLPGHCLFTAINGAANQVNYEILTRLACRDIIPHTPTFVPPQPTSSWLSHILETGQTTQEEGGMFAHQESIPSTEVWLSQCRKSSAVQKRTTRFVTTNMMVGGLLAALTSKYWGSLSDRRGRLPVVAMASVSDIINYTAQLLVALHPSLGFRTILLGTALAYSMGGGMTAQAVNYAYASDCVSEGSRAPIFALVDGFLSLGLILGPSIGSIVVRLTGQLLASFYTMIVLRSLYLFYVLLVVPESLSPERRAQEQERYNSSLLSQLQSRSRDRAASAGRNSRGSWARRVARAMGRVARGLWAPVAILVQGPVHVERKGEERSTNEGVPLLGSDRGGVAGVKEEQDRKKGARNILWAALTFFLVSINPAITPVKILYGRFKFNWHVEQTGYWTSFNSISKLFVLLVVVPAATSFFRKMHALPQGEVRPTRGDDVMTEEDERELKFRQEEWDNEEKKLRSLSEITFDLQLAKVSIATCAFGYLIMSLPSSPSPSTATSDSPTFFLIGTALAQTSGGVVPAVQSLTLSLTPSHDVGRVLAALSVLASLSVQIVGPLLFGSVYIGSVDWFPELAFVVAVFWWAMALVPARFVRLPEVRREGLEEYEEVE